MAGAQHEMFNRQSQYDRAFWYSPGGWDNGLDDDMWVSVLDVADSLIATIMLFDLRQHGVPAYAATLGGAHKSGSLIRVWVGASRFGTAQSNLMRLMPELIARFGPGIVR